MTSIEPPAGMPYGIEPEDIAMVEREGRTAFLQGRALGSYDYYPGTTLANAFVRGWTQAAAEASRNVQS